MDAGAEGLPFPGLTTIDEDPVSIVCKLISEAQPTFITLFRWLVDDSAMLQAAEIKHTHATVSTATDKDVYTVCTETNVVDFFIMCDELCFGC
jgi:hypothetical protein